MIFTLITILTFLCWISALLLIRGQKSFFFHFKWFLGLATLVELMGYLWYFQLGYSSNHWIFNAFLFVEICFLSFIFSQVLSRYYNYRPWLFAGLAIFVMSYFTESIGDSFREMSMMSKKLASVYIILLCLSYYYHLLRKDEYVLLKFHPDFWLVTGCFFFYFGSATCDIFFDYLLELNQVSLKPVRYIIFVVLNFILYLCWSYSFLCKSRPTIL